MIIRRITPRTTFDNLKKEAKRWLRELRSNDAEARARFERASPNAPANPGLRDVQHALAVEYGMSGWAALKKVAVESQAPDPVAQYERLAGDMVTVNADGDPAAMQRINEFYGRSSTVEDLRATIWRLIYKVRRAAGAADAFGLEEARELIARTDGFHNWSSLTEAAAKGDPPPGSRLAQSTGRENPHRAAPDCRPD